MEIYRNEKVKDIIFISPHNETIQFFDPAVLPLFPIDVPGSNLLKCISNLVIPFGRGDEIRKMKYKPFNTEMELICKHCNSIKNKTCIELNLYNNFIETLKNETFAWIKNKRKSPQIKKVKRNC
jgi:hypothetical protein